ncbi:MAG: hypothetical protein QM576_04355 [Rhodopseudomonas sp.]|uniref:hypothetical protein n=1 Tax=Rhodopseudomonas sp. TaxID=1078 RepID=UPI0039E47F6F
MTSAQMTPAMQRGLAWFADQYGGVSYFKKGAPGFSTRQKLLDAGLIERRPVLHRRRRRGPDFYWCISLDGVIASGVNRMSVIGFRVVLAAGVRVEGAYFTVSGASPGDRVQICRDGSRLVALDADSGAYLGECTPKSPRSSVSTGSASEAGEARHLRQVVGCEGSSRSSRD